MLNNSYKTESKISQVQMWGLVVLRVAIGWHLLYEGIVKLLMPNWTSAAYLEISRWIFGGFFQWIASTPSLLKVVDLVNIWGLILIGLALMLGFFTRGASIAGMILLGLYYLANPPFVGLDFGIPTEGNYLVVDKNLVEILALFVMALFPTGHFIGLDRLFISGQTSIEYTAKPEQSEIVAKLAKPVSKGPFSRRDLIRSTATLPVLGAFAVSFHQKKKWESWEEQNLVDAMTAASNKSVNLAGLDELRGQVPKAKIGNAEFSRIILGGNLLSGWAHSRDLIYVSQLVKAYHHKERIFGTLLMAEKCGVNTLLTNPILCSIITEYWKRDIGKIQFISDCVGLNYTDKGAAQAPKEEFFGRIKKAIDHGAISCYVQGETADYYIQQNQPEVIAEALDLINRNGILAGIGAHRIETIQACVEQGFDPDYWMKTLHHKNYWSAKHPTWHDNLYCDTPEETIAFMATVKQPWIAFKTLAAGAIHPREGFRFAFEGGADFVCAGMYDFQMVEDVNIALDILGDDLDSKRTRAWRA